MTSATETLHVALVAGPREQAVWARLPQFEEQTGVMVEIASLLPRQEHFAHLAEALPAGDPGYDLVCADLRYAADWAAHLLPLESQLSASELDDFCPATTALLRCGGALTMLPRRSDVRLLHFRMDLFDSMSEKHGFAEVSTGRELRLPDAWDELGLAAQYFTRPPQMHGFAFPGRDEGLFATWLEMFASVGGRLVDDAGRPAFADGYGEWAANMLHNLFNRWNVCPEEGLQWGFDEVSEGFRMGRFALAMDGPAGFELMCDTSFSAVAGWLSLALAPQGTQNRRCVYVDVPTLAIPAASTCVEPAVALLRFLTDDESQAVEVEQSGIPARLSARAAAKAELREGALAHRRWTLIEKALGTTTLVPLPFPGYPQLVETITPFIQQAMTGALTAQQAMMQARAALSPKPETPSRLSGPK